MIGKFILLCAVVYSQAAELHNYMTDEEVERIFRVPRHAVPDYEVIPVLHTLHKRSTAATQKVQLKAFGKHVELNLTPNDGILYGYDTPVMVAVPDRTQLFGVRFDKVLNPFKGVGIPYHDRRTRSAVVLSKDIDKSVQMSGRILDDWVLEPAPLRLHNLLKSERIVDETDDTFDQTHHHIIFKQPYRTSEEKSRELDLIENEEVHQNGSHSRAQRSVPNAIYPEILITMDYSLFKTQDNDFTKALSYLLAFWNSVDLRFQLISTPKIRLNIAGFIISKDPSGTPFIVNDGQGFVNVDPALNGMRSFFYPDGRIRIHYDIAMAMTHLDLFSTTSGREVVGYATVNGSCTVNNYERKTYAVGLIEDSGTYSGILTAAHELGHLLGASHDGATNCPEDDGFMMGAVSNNKATNYYWSPCSVKLIREAMSGGNDCLQNIPKPGIPLSRILPGKLMSLDEQCQKRLNSPAYPGKANVSCEQLWCHTSEFQTKTVSAAIEGSYCGEQKHCVSGECVYDTSGIPSAAPVGRKPAPPQIRYNQLPTFNQAKSPTSHQNLASLLPEEIRRQLAPQTLNHLTPQLVKQMLDFWNRREGGTFKFNIQYYE